jgi:hypothetical protein
MTDHQAREQESKQEPWSHGKDRYGARSTSSLTPPTPLSTTRAIRPSNASVSSNCRRLIQSNANNRHAAPCAATSVPDHADVACIAAEVLHVACRYAAPRAAQPSHQLPQVGLTRPVCSDCRQRSTFTLNMQMSSHHACHSNNALATYAPDHTDVACVAAEVLHVACQYAAPRAAQPSHQLAQVGPTRPMRSDCCQR